MVVEAFAFGSPTTVDQSDGGQHYTLACQWSASTNGVVSGNRWRAPNVGPGTQCRMCLYRISDQVKVAESNLFTATPAVEQDVAFITPFSAVAGVAYASGVVTNRYAYKNPGGWPYTTASMTAAAGVNGRLEFTSSGVPVFPAQISGAGLNFMIGPLFEAEAITATGRATIIIAAGKRAARTVFRKPLIFRSPVYPILTGIPVRYEITGPGLKWTVAMSLTHVSVLSREFLPFDVAAYVAGRPYNPTGCAFAVAFLESSRSEPVPGDWVTGDWDTTTIGTYVGRVLVGPGSGAVLAAGRYYPWVRITDPTSGETVVRQVGKLFID